MTPALPVLAVGAIRISAYHVPLAGYWNEAGWVTSSARWSLTQKALERLLERLGPDSEAAGREYQSLRARLLDYFDWKGVHRPDVAADETLDRVARRLDEGEPVQRVGAYVHGVARLVLLEQLRLQLREQRVSAALAHELTQGPEASDEARIACLVRCLERLPEEERSLIVGYYEGAGRSHLEGRKLLANRLGIGSATLKSRAHRLRVRLETWLRECLDGGGPCE